MSTYGGNIHESGNLTNEAELVVMISSCSLHQEADHMSTYVVPTKKKESLYDSKNFNV